VSIAVIALVSATAVVLAQGGFKKISEILTGYEETEPLRRVSAMMSRKLNGS
jgi:hypothetical protein